MKEFIYKKLIVYLVLFQPVIDIITSLMVINNQQLTIGIITKGIFLVLAVIYLVFIDKGRRKYNIFYLAILMIFSILNILNNSSIIEVEFFSYFSYLFKYVYHLVVLWFFVRWYKNYSIKLYELRTPILIITLTYFIAIITNTAYNSYFFSSVKQGYSGWFSSANELGNILCLLFPISIYNAFHNKDGIKLDTILFILTSACMLLIGTKVGLMGFYGIIGFYILIRIIFISKKPFDKGIMITLIMLIISLGFFTKLPAVYNIKHNASNELEYLLLSGRREMLTKIKKEYDKSNTFDKIIGKSYYGEVKGEMSIMIAEQDFFDIFFMYGYLGLTLVLISYILVYVVLIKKIINYYQLKHRFSKKHMTLILAISLELSVAFISGHAFLSASVATYLTLIVAMIFNLEINYHSDKKTVLITDKDKLYQKLDQEKYDVTVLVTGNNEVHNYNVLYPYYFNGKLLHSKSLKKLFFNKFTAYIVNRNQKYDIVLGDNNNTVFDNYYLYYTSANKKLLIGKKSNKLFSQVISRNEINML